MEFTARLSPDNVAWVHSLAAEHDATLSATIMQIVEDARTWWALPKDSVRALAADAKALGLNQRDYIFYLLRERVQELHGKA
jgi:hypothetical protein